MISIEVDEHVARVLKRGICEIVNDLENVEIDLERKRSSLARADRVLDDYIQTLRKIAALEPASLGAQTMASDALARNY